MILSEAIPLINYALRGIDDDAPVEGTDEYSYWVSTLNRKKNELYQDVTKRWAITYEKRSFGTIAASEDPSFDLDEDFLAPSNEVYVLKDGSRTRFRLVKPEEVPENIRVAYIAGDDPQVLYISKEITSDESFVGGTLYVPGYYLPDDFTSPSDTLLVPDPYWLVMATAAEVAYNDIIYEDKAEGLNNKANNLYAMMVAKNRRGTFDNPRTVTTRLNRIRGPRSSK